MRDAMMAARLRCLAIEAGAAIMRVFAAADIGLRVKADASPVTAADLAADALIWAGLTAAYPEIPVVTEERAANHRAGMGGAHFLVDPLDGTREFAARRREFTVNIALIEAGAPIAGIVYAPALGRLFRTGHGGGAVEETGPFDPAAPGPTRRMTTAPPDNAALRIVASRSHRTPETDAFIARCAPGAVTSVGSSLKFCLVAAGEADLYPCLGPTMEWDTAAGHAVLGAAGGHVVRALDGAPLRYGRPGRANPPFIAFADGVTPPIR